MHFPISGTTILDSDEESIDAVSVKDGAIFIVLSTDAISLWHTGSLSLIQSIRHVTATLESIGLNRRLFLRADELVLVVQTSGNVLLIYDLCEDATEEARLLQTANDHGVPKVWLKHRQNVRVEAGVLALCATSKQLIISTKKPPMIQNLVWPNEGDDICTESSLLSTMEFLHCKGRKSLSRVLEIVPCGDSKSDVFLWFMSSGEVYMVTLSSLHWTGIILHNPTSSNDCAVLGSFNSRARLITMSLADNRAVTYSIRNVSTDNPLPESSQLCSVTCAVDHGPPRSLSWSPDGMSLLICSERGWSLWSLMGALVANSQEPDAETTSYGSFRTAVWINAGYSALFLTLQKNTLVVHNYCISKGPNLQFLKRLHYRSETSSERFLNNNKHSTIPWRSIALPSQLLVSGPMVFSSFASFDNSVAMSARYGLGYYSKDSTSWKLYKTPESAASISLIVDPVWINNLLVAAVQTSEGLHQIRLFSEELDLEEPVEMINSNGRIVALTAKDDYVYTLYRDRRVAKYEIIRTQGDTVRMLLRSEGKLQDDVPEYEVAVKFVAVIHDPGYLTTSHLLVLEGDLLNALCLSSASESRLSQVLISSGVEWCQCIDGIGPLRNAVFAYCGGQMKLWFNFLRLQELLVTLPECSTRFDLDFYPLAVSLESGLIDGLEMSQLRSLEGDPFQWKMLDRSMTFLPNVIGTLLKIDHLGEALVVAGSYAHLPYFSHILEVLLSKALEDEIDNQAGLLSRTWLLLEHYELLLPAIIVSCARKTEVDYWETLFKIAGSPKTLYNKCVIQNDLKTAAAYLIVLHTMDAQLDHKIYTLDLYEKAVLQEDWNLATDLARFYCTVVDDKKQAVKDLKALIMNEC